jgi:hypothetical protein
MRTRILAFLCAGASLALVVAACSSSNSSNGTGGSGTGGSGTGGSGTGGNSGSSGSGGATGGSGGTAGSGGSSGGSGGSSGGSGGSSGGSGGSSGGSGGSGGSSSSLPTIGGCTVFTGNDDWNKDISGEGVDATWTQRIQNIVGNINIHPDYGPPDYGIPINVVPASQAKLPISFDKSPNESDPGPYPFPGPANVKIEGGTATNCSGDCHVIVVQQGACMLYEGWSCHYGSSGWVCGSGAKWDLTKLSYGQRKMGWTSADAAGLPIMPGLVRYAEVQAGAINHAIRFTLECSMNKYVKPATHFAAHGSCGSNAPPMGLRVRLKASYDISGLTKGAQVVLKAMKKYGMILADNSSPNGNFYFQGEVNPNWKDADISALKTVPASAFEVVTLPPLQP